MSLYLLKPRFQRLLRPAVDGLARAGVSPNAVTTSAIVLSLAVAAGVPGAAAEVGGLAFLALPAAQLLRMALNAVDGEIARRHRRSTRAGAVLNEAGDALNAALFVVPFLFVPAVPASGVVLLAAACVASEYAGVLAWAVTGVRRYDGPLGKADQALATSGLALWVAAGTPGPAGLGTALVGALVVLAVITAGRRLRLAPGGVKA